MRRKIQYETATSAETLHLSFGFDLGLAESVDNEGSMSANTERVVIVPDPSDDTLRHQIQHQLVLLRAGFAPGVQTACMAHLLLCSMAAVDPLHASLPGRFASPPPKSRSFGHFSRRRRDGSQLVDCSGKQAALHPTAGQGDATGAMGRRTSSARLLKGKGIFTQSDCITAKEEEATKRSLGSVVRMLCNSFRVEQRWLMIIASYCQRTLVPVAPTLRVVEIAGPGKSEGKQQCHCRVM